MLKSFEKEALEYHSQGKPGKVDVQSSKKCDTEYDLSLAYSPGVAAPCKEIAKDPSLVSKYTSRGNLVAVITNGSAVLGLGNIGPLAAKPVMEGKGVLFKQFAGIDVFDLELDTKSPEDFIKAVQALEPTFGGINLEDIASPDCFIIEKALRETMNIPIFHDDQHGTAIISTAALLNACKVANKDLKKIKVVYNGAGAASISCARLMVKLGVNPQNLIMCDSKGAIYKGRKEGMNEYKQEFAIETDARTLEDALNGADVFCGLSVGNVMTQKMLKSMADKPIVFAMANPDPEIDPGLAKEARKDVIVATGRSDFPNQVNNVLGFPSIFRGALDVCATQITEEMKIAAVHALAELAQEEVPDSVSVLYDNKPFSFGPDYIIPKPFDPRVLMYVAPAVAKAAMDSGVALEPIKNFKAYREKLEALNSFSRGFIRSSINRIKSNKRKNGASLPKIIFPEGHSTKILKALNTIRRENIIEPVLLGYKDNVQKKIKELELEEISDLPIYRPAEHEYYQKYVNAFFEMRKRKGVMLSEAERLVSNPFYYSAMALEMGDVDGLISGASQNYADCIKPLFQVIGTKDNQVASGLNMVLIGDKMIFFSDTTVNIDPTAEELAKIAINCAEVAKNHKIEPRIAMLSFTNFTGRSGSPAKMKRAAQLVNEMRPDLIVDGEIQADTAVNPEIVERIFPFCNIKGGANVLIFPNLDASNIAYKLVQQLGGGEVLGPFILGIKKPANVLQRTGTVDDVINTIVLTALETQET